MNTRRILAAIIATVTLTIATSCHKDMDVVSTNGHNGLNGNTVRFGAATSYRTKVLTKTVYGGNYSDDNKTESINWVPGSDKIRVMCQQATLISGSEKFSDYNVTKKQDAKEKSFADIVPSTGNGLQWGTTFPHFFYALYPSQSISNGETVPTSTLETQGTNNALITGVIPATQVVKKSTDFSTDHTYRPNMNYAYMYAAEKVTALPTSKYVNLSFKPLITTFEFAISTQSGTEAIDEKLISVSLSSTTTNLTGDFKATITDLGYDPTALVIENPGKSITVSIPDGGIQLSSSTPYKITMLALPVAQTDLTVTLNFEGGLKRILKLDKKESSNMVPITVPATHKANILISAPKTTTTTVFDVVGPATATLTKAGGSATFEITSYKTNHTGVHTGSAWTTQFSTDYGKTWTDSKPDWLTDFTTTGGGSDGTTYTFSFSENTSTTWANKTEIGAEANPRDLSRYDIYGSPYGGSESSTPQNTANCYVISQPGWYRIPCVYGNAIKNGSVNEAAYKTTSYTGTNALAAFLKHDETAITDPWIENNTVTISGIEDNIAVDGASLVWESIKDLIKDAQIDRYDGKAYIKFYVDKDKIAQGNAVIAAKSGTTIVWSWHLWFMDNPSQNLATIPIYSYPDIPYKSVVEPNNMLSAALGFTKGNKIPPRHVMVKFKQTATGKEKQLYLLQDGNIGDGASVTHYQWGRKDPMIPAIIATTSERTVYDAAGIAISAQQTTSDAYDYLQYSISIQKPHMFCKPSGINISWFGIHYHNLWNSSMTTRGKDEVVTKTVYDPCPPGFKVPNKNVFTGFTDEPMNEVSGTGLYAIKPNSSTDKGFYFYAQHSAPEQGVVFVPYTGYRGQTSGVYKDSEFGKYWTASYDPTVDAPLFLNFSGNKAQTLRSNASFSNAAGFAIMPVAE